MSDVQAPLVGHLPNSANSGSESSVPGRASERSEKCDGGREMNWIGLSSARRCMFTSSFSCNSPANFASFMTAAMRSLVLTLGSRANFAMISRRSRMVSVVVVALAF